MALPVTPYHGEIGFLNGNSFTFDSDSNRWVLLRRKTVIDVDSDISNLSIRNFLDINVDYPEDGTVLQWDSDNQYWGAVSIDRALGATAFTIDEFVSTAGQTTFKLSYSPVDDVSFVRNGMNLQKSVYTVSGRTVTTTVVLDSDDEIQIGYNRGSNASYSNELNDLNDVSIDTAQFRHGDLLAWDSDVGQFTRYDMPTEMLVLRNRVTELELDLQQAVADRVFTDQLLSSRIDSLDSDVGARGSFFVQPTAPSGAANVGWLDTSTMKLKVWDVTEGTWIAVTTT